MDEADAELTRLAVQEILQEMQIYKEREERPIQERKINPIARTNKNFLGRTLNAMVQHNKRTDERTRKKCNKKLRELDEQRYKHSYDTKSHHSRKRSHHSKDVIETTDSETDVKIKISHKRSKTKKKKKKRHRRSPSHCSSSSEEQGSTNKHQEFGYNRNEYYSSNNLLDAAEEELDPSAYFMAPTLWDIQMQQFYQYKALMAFSCAAAQADSNSTVQIVELDSSSSSSLSDINLDEPNLSSSDEDRSGLLTINVTDDSTSSSSSSSSSGGEEENAKILTINVTDDENTAEAEKSVKDVNSKKVPEKSSKIVNEINHPTVIIDDEDSISLHSTDSSDNETVKAAIDLTAD